MAKATQRIEEVEKVVTVKEEVETFTLELTRDEARTLVALTGCISGASGVRTLASSVYSALYGAGLPNTRFIKGDGNFLYISGTGATLQDR